MDYSEPDYFVVLRIQRGRLNLVLCTWGLSFKRRTFSLYRTPMISLISPRYQNRRNLIFRHSNHIPHSSTVSFGIMSGFCSISGLNPARYSSSFFFQSKSMVVIIMSVAGRLLELQIRVSLIFSAALSIPRH